jgi:GNAT superfamily N-acetyltransferase
MSFPFPVVDRELAQKLERAEGSANAAFVMARAATTPASGATWIEVAGAYAMFDGVESPITQTFGLGLFDPVGPAEMDRLEAFFAERGAPVHHEVCPLADKSLLPLLVERGYSPVELSSVLYLPLPTATAARPSPITVRVAKANELEQWAQTCAAGWSEYPEFAHMILDLARIMAAREGGYPFVAEINGQMAATGSLSMEGRVALLAGASTVPAFRKMGAQQALLEARLQFAAEQGCELAMMAAEPGSASQRNAERKGFRIAYTRTKWRLGR